MELFTAWSSRSCVLAKRLNPYEYIFCLFLHYWRNHKPFTHPWSHFSTANLQSMCSAWVCFCVGFVLFFILYAFGCQRWQKRGKEVTCIWFVLHCAISWIIPVLRHLFYSVMFTDMLVLEVLKKFVYVKKKSLASYQRKMQNFCWV